VAKFWQEALDYKPDGRWENDGILEVEIAPKDGHGISVLFLTDPEPKTVKNRWHFDARAAVRASRESGAPAGYARTSPCGLVALPSEQQAPPKGGQARSAPIANPSFVSAAIR